MDARQAYDATTAQIVAKRAAARTEIDAAIQDAIKRGEYFVLVPSS